MVSLHAAQTSSASGKGPVINLTYYLGKVTVRRLPAKSDSTVSGELRLQGQASDCLGKSRAFCLSSPGASRQTEPRPNCGKQGSLRTVPIHGAEDQSGFQAGWRAIGPDNTSSLSVINIYIFKKIQSESCISQVEVSQFTSTLNKLSLATLGDAWKKIQLKVRRCWGRSYRQIYAWMHREKKTTHKLETRCLAKMYSYPGSSSIFHLPFSNLPWAGSNKAQTRGSRKCCLSRTAGRISVTELLRWYRQRSQKNHWTHPQLLLCLK